MVSWGQGVLQSDHTRQQISCERFIGVEESKRPSWSEDMKEKETDRQTERLEEKDQGNDLGWQRPL